MFTRVYKNAAVSAVALIAMAGSAMAEKEFSLYMGYQTLPHSRISGNDGNGTSFDKLIGWEGRSDSMPPYYGMRFMWWRTDKLGLGIEFTHAKAYAPNNEMAPEFSRMEFTDGHNIITLNAHRRWKGQWAKGKVSPYVIGGVGFAMPHVDIQPTYAGAPRTYGYQITGPALRLGAGASWALSDRFSLFGEYQFTISDNKVDINGGGSASVVLKTNAVNFGLSYSF